MTSEKYCLIAPCIYNITILCSTQYLSTIYNLHPPASCFMMLTNQFVSECKYLCYRSDLLPPPSHCLLLKACKFVQIRAACLSSHF